MLIKNYIDNGLRNLREDCGTDIADVFCNICKYLIPKDYNRYPQFKDLQFDEECLYDNDDYINEVLLLRLKTKNDSYKYFTLTVSYYYYKRKEKECDNVKYNNKTNEFIYWINGKYGYYQFTLSDKFSKEYEKHIRDYSKMDEDSIVSYMLFMEAYSIEMQKEGK